MTKQLVKRAVTLYPKADYLDPQAVRHARREWLKAVSHLRNSNNWILDQPVQRLQ